MTSLSNKFSVSVGEQQAHYCGVLIPPVDPPTISGRRSESALSRACNLVLTTLCMVLTFAYVALAVFDPALLSCMFGDPPPFK